MSGPKKIPYLSIKDTAMYIYRFLLAQKQN